MNIDTWGLPGGHLEANESFEECAEREILEEAGLHVRHLKFLTATNDIMPVEGKHYVTIFMKGVMCDESAQPQVCSILFRFAFVFACQCLAMCADSWSRFLK